MTAIAIVWQRPC